MNLIASLLLTIVFLFSDSARGQGRFVELRGKKQYVLTEGSGEPTVVFVAGKGCPQTDFKLVYDAIKKQSRIFSYDRAGLGKSESLDNDRRVDTMAYELHELLTKENIKPPYILVGHSMGGFVIRCFANRYPEQVSGMIFVDGAYETEYKESCAMRSAADRLKYQQEYKSYLHIPTQSKGYNDESKFYFNYDSTGYGTNENIVKDIPLPANIPITALVSMQLVPGNKYSKKECDVYLDFINAWKLQNKDLKIITTINSGHFIHIDEPKLVIEAVTEMISSINKTPLIEKSKIDVPGNTFVLSTLELALGKDSLGKFIYHAKNNEQVVEVNISKGAMGPAMQSLRSTTSHSGIWIGSNNNKIDYSLITIAISKPVTSLSVGLSAVNNDDAGQETIRNFSVFDSLGNDISAQTKINWITGIASGLENSNELATMYNKSARTITAKPGFCCDAASGRITISSTTPFRKITFAHQEIGPKLSPNGIVVTGNLLFSTAPPYRQPIALHNVLFENGKAELLESSYSDLNPLINEMKASPTMTIELHGHTDNSGDHAQNQVLSELRVASVKSYLMQKGIQASRIVEKGFGDSRPLVPNTTDPNRQKNRRVEFLITAF